MLAYQTRFLYITLSICIVRVTSDFPIGARYNYTPWATVGSWFLGPRAENYDTFLDMLKKIVTSQKNVRQNTYKWDKPYIDQEMSNCKNFRSEVDQLENELETILEELSQSVPFYSMRYQGHMNWDTTMPAQLGYFAAMLYNQNNVAAEGSPITTGYEIEVGEHLCQMLGYSNTNTTSNPKCWAHITSCGTIANIESGWAARNLKYFPIAVKNLVKKHHYTECDDYSIKIITGEEKLLNSLSYWELLNLDLDVVSDLFNNIKDHICQKRNLTPEEAAQFNEIIDKQLEELTLQTLGLSQFRDEHNVNSTQIEAKILVPATMHYSWPKMATLLGLGKASVEPIILDKEARVDIVDLEQKLDMYLGRKQPIMMVVGVVGTTEESSVDPIADIMKVRENYRKKGLNFWIHADGAWGGYYRTLINIEKPVALSDIAVIADQYVPVFPVNEYTLNQLKALPGCDSITLDPHKSGYIQYPAGALAYRNIAYRNFVTIKAPVVYHGGVDPTVGIYGVEGSTPGAAPTAVLLSHRVIGLDENGYGRILGQAMYGAKLFYSMWLTVARDDDPFNCFPMKPLPNDCLPNRCSIPAAKEFIRTHIASKSNAYIFSNNDILNFLHKVGPDTSINAFACNYKVGGQHTINKNIELANEYNRCIFQHLSYSNLNTDVRRVPLMLTSSEKDPKAFGTALSLFKSTMGLDNINGVEPVQFLINTVANPLQTSEGHVSSMAESFRETALVCYGKMTDTPGYHGFVMAGHIEQDGKFYGDHLSVFKDPKHQYQAILRFKLLQEDNIVLINDKLDEDKTIPIIIINNLEKKPRKLHDIAFDQGKKTSINYDIFHGFENVPGKPFLRNVEIKTDDVLYFKHFEESWKTNTTNTNLPENGDLRYFLYGTETQSFVSKINDGHFPDIHHIQELKHGKTRPPFPEDTLEFGIIVNIVHPKNKLVKKDDWIAPFYMPAIIQSKRSDHCDDKQTMDLRNMNSCLTTIFPSKTKNEPNLIEFQRSYGDSKIPDVLKLRSVIYGKRDIWFDAIEINKGLTDEQTPDATTPTPIPDIEGKVVQSSGSKCADKSPCFCREDTCLVGGSRNEGNIYISGRPVCDDHWGGPGDSGTHGPNNAKVVCRSLGFHHRTTGQWVTGKRTTHSKYGRVPDNDWALDNVKCNGNENDIRDCPAVKGADSQGCAAREGAGVICN